MEKFLEKSKSIIKFGGLVLGTIMMALSISKLMFPKEVDDIWNYAAYSEPTKPGLIAFLAVSLIYLLFESLNCHGAYRHSKEALDSADDERTREILERQTNRLKYIPLGTAVSSFMVPLGVYGFAVLLMITVPKLFFWATHKILESRLIYKI